MFFYLFSLSFSPFSSFLFFVGPLDINVLQALSTQSSLDIQSYKLCVQSIGLSVLFEAGKRRARLVVQLSWTQIEWSMAIGCMERMYGISIDAG